MKPVGLIALILLVPLSIGVSSPAVPVPIVPLEKPTFRVLETLTIYHPVEHQCDDSPLITASNAHIDLEKLKRQEIRWMALSRNLLKRWNGDFNYGDTVFLEAGDPSIDGLWVINDNMNKRFRDRGDLLFHIDSRSGGIWRNVRMRAVSSKP